MRNMIYFMLGVTLMLLVGVVLGNEAHADEYYYVELGQGFQVGDMPWGDSNWQGDYPTSFAFGYHIEDYEKYMRIEFAHISNVLDGAPFNDNQETWLDVVWVKYGIKF